MAAGLYPLSPEVALRLAAIATQHLHVTSGSKKFDIDKFECACA